MSSAATNDVKTAVPIFDGSNYNVWVDQMKFWLQSQNLWRIVNGAILRPTVSPGLPPVTAQDVAVWDDINEAAFGTIFLRIAHHMWAAILTAANTTSALVWTSITTTWSQTGISAIYQDYKATIRIRVGTSNPAKDITRLQTHFEHLSANNAPVSAYEQGMILLSAIPDEWDHQQPITCRHARHWLMCPSTQSTRPFWPSMTVAVGAAPTNPMSWIKYL